jgi:hypothetical protein
MRGGRAPHAHECMQTDRRMGRANPLTNFTFWGRLPAIPAALREQNGR